MGNYGGAGSGKTWTSARVAIGLSSRVGDGKPVAFFDTETGSDYVLPLFRDAGVELLVVKSRAFADLVEFVSEAESMCSVAIVDSITQVWDELREAYEKKLGRTTGLEIWDWAPIKREWRQFTDVYLNSRIHMIVCGRAGEVYEREWNDERQKYEVVVTDTKMRTEKELAYEPSLLVELERVSLRQMKGSEKGERGKLRRGWTHRATVIKDRTDAMNGAQIDNPTFESFLPVIERLNIGGAHVGIDTSRDSQGLFSSPERSMNERRRQVEIVLEEVQEALTLGGLDGTAVEAKRQRVALLKRVFGTSSKTAIEGMQLELLQAGLKVLRQDLGLCSTSQKSDAAADPRIGTAGSEDLDRREETRV
jgi:hypothetical protein